LLWVTVDAEKDKMNGGNKIEDEDEDEDERRG
jgi:hypothetical protein